MIIKLKVIYYIKLYKIYVVVYINTFNYET
jgi:hypothetical protein